MESGITNESRPAVAETQTVVKTDSADSFQSFIYELFEKNGILNDLRAYLRGHIVNVLKSAQTGDPPPCQKNFTKRLDLTYQAVNMLIAEYLIRLDFSYSFSVFVSEIPLANMVFGFAKSLMEKIDENKTDMRFKETDVWSIINYLGMQCDSEHASNVVQMYNNEKLPLLLCILKGMPMHKEFVEPPQSISEDSVATSKSMDSTEIENPLKKNFSETPECSHWVYCKKCQNKMYKLKDKYKKKKKYLAKNIKNKESTNKSPVNSESLVKNISIMEKDLIEEMFQQLKAVYEKEVEMVKAEEEKKVKRSMATHAMQLQQKRNELEETFKAREVEMERNVQHKKKFLWGLARSLRVQHQHMTRAIKDVRAETERLEVKENSLKTQLAEAEQILKQRGEEMRLQITDELTILERHLESMKREREHITRQRYELEDMKTVQDIASNVMKVHNLETEEVHSHYKLLQNELAILKTYLESSQMQAKCVIERGTITEASEPVSQINITLNNNQGNEKSSKTDDFDGRVKMNQVVNDFRKKNVNFSQSNLDEIYRERSSERSRSSNSSEAGDTAAPDLDLDRGRDRDLIQRLRDENDRLKAFARQRRPRSAVAPRPRTAPPAPARLQVFPLNTSVSASTLNVGWRKGAGEELSIFSNAQPRILVPGDTLPFIGVLRDRHGNNRRPRALAGVSKRAASPFRERHALAAGSSAQGGRAHLPVASCSLQPDDGAYRVMRDRMQQRPRTALSLENRIRDKSPKSLLKEAKDKLRRKDSNKACSELPRDKSPTAVLREAKQRLRKLEIEAEAVEKSYLDFRRRQSERDDCARPLDVTRSPSTQELDATTKNDIEAQFADLQKSMRGDFDKYIRDYKTKFDIGETHFRNKPTVAERAKPIPDTFVADCTDHVNAHGNYLETPLIEFRKLYTCARQAQRDDTELRSPTGSTRSDNESMIKTEFNYENSARNNTLRQAKHNKQAELQILKQNINQMYHLPNNNSDSAATVEQQVNQTYRAMDEHENKLRVEVESISEINDIRSPNQDLLLVVESSVNSKQVKMSNFEVPSELFSAQMTIIVSPKRRNSETEEGGVLCVSERARRSVSPEQAAHLTRNDVLDAIFHADPNNEVSSVQMQLELSKDEDDSISEYDKADYPGDYVDMDNYNSRSDGVTSPISVPGVAENDNFWEA